jgi:hypothetical protein
MASASPHHLDDCSLHFEDIGIYLCDLEIDSKKVKKE